jgi:hypothetical protein
MPYQAPTQQEIDERRQEDLKRIVEAEAMLLLMLRGSVRSVAGIKDPVRRSESLFGLAQSAIQSGWQTAAESSFAATSDQLLGAVGYRLPEAAEQVWDRLAQQAETSAARGAHGIVNRMLAEELGQGGKLGLNLEGVAASEAAEAYNRARDEVVARLPQHVRDELWLRRDTAGDRAVCGRCERLDGKIAPISVGISPLVPLHSKCRCTDTIISHDEAMAYADALAYPERGKQAVVQGAPLPAAPAKATTTKPRAPRKVSPEVAAKREAVASAKAELAEAKKLAAEEKRRLAAEAKAAKAAAKLAKPSAAKKTPSSSRLTAPPSGKVFSGAVDSKAQKLIAEVDKESAAVQSRLERIRAKVAAGGPDKWNSLGIAEKDLAALSEKRESILRSSKVRGSTRYVNSVEAALDSRLLTVPERSAISEFTGTSYTSIRRAQSEDLPRLLKSDPELWGSIAKKAKNLEQAIASNVQYEGEIWRGITVDKATAERILGSKDISWMGQSTSTSTLKSEAERFAMPREDSVGIIFRAKNGRGLPVRDIGIPHEEEILMSGASKFRVIGSPVRDGERWLVELEQVEAKAARAVRKTTEDKLAASETRKSAAEAKKLAAAQKKTEAAAKRAEAAQAKREAADAKRASVEQRKAAAEAKRAEAAAKREARAEAARAKVEAKTAKRATSTQTETYSVKIDRDWQPARQLTIAERKEATEALKVRYAGSVKETKDGVLSLPDNGKKLRQASRKHLDDTLGVKSFETRHGRTNWKTVRFTDEIPDTYGAAHNWDGEMLVPSSKRDGFLRGMRSGETASIKDTIHEELHGCSPIGMSAYDLEKVGNKYFAHTGSAIEEATTEYLASKSVGMTWIQASHPYRAVGDDLCEIIGNTLGIRKNEAIKRFDRAALYNRRAGAPIVKTPRQMAEEFAAGVEPNDTGLRGKLVDALMGYSRQIM